MQSNITKTKIKGAFQMLFLVLTLFCLLIGKVNAQTYSNGPLSTGATSSNGTAAPAGSTWSEVQNPNTNAGYSAAITTTGGFTVADNFTVVGSWTITTATFYAYSTGFTGTTSPFTDVRVRIYNTDPSVGSPTPIYGDLTTNRFASSTFTNMYRIFNATPATNRKIWAINANINTTLTSGTYWIEWQVGNGGLSNFSPAVTIVGAATQPGWNGKQRTPPSTWASLVDGGGPQDMPFVLNYTTSACAGTPAPGNTVTSAAAVCPAQSFALSLQNPTPGSGVTYQFQSASSVGGPYTNITGATNSTYTTTITATTFYQVIVTCNGVSTTSTPVQVSLNPPSACYCAAGATSTAFEKISNVTLNTINNNSTSTAGYENFTALTTTLEAGRPYPFSVSISGAFSSDQVLIWIDYNHNGSFTDAGELVYTSAQGVGPHTGTLFVPFTALSGTTRMRVRMHDASLGANATSCGNSSYGQVEDYSVNILPVVACSGTPAPGNTLSNVTTQCAGVNINLSLQNFTSGSGVTYQYQSSPTGAPGTFTNITGATSAIYTTTQSASTFYQAIVTCGGVSTTSTPVQVLLTPFTGCYCASAATSIADEDIFNVSLGTLNNTSSCTSVGPGPGSILRRYANYRSGTGAPAAPDLVQGGTYPLSVRVGTCGGNYPSAVAVWIDFNQDGAFTATEKVYVSPSTTTGPHFELGNIVIPATATLGVTGMRVVNVESFAYNTNTIQPCGTYTWGETEDYLVNIVPCVQGAITTQPVNKTVGCSGTTTFSTVATGSLLTYTWEYRVNATSPWLLVPNAAPYSGLGTSTLTISNTPQTLSGYQYRVLVSGPCTAPFFSTEATLTVGPLVATTNVASANICAGTIQALSVTNILAPTQAVQTFTSGPLTLLIPDANLTGVTHGIPVTLPTGAQITGVKVTLNMNHSWDGDMVFALKAPNNAILNLDWYLSGTGGAGPTTGFVNTAISSAGTAALSSGSNPYTGTFRADAAAGTPGNPAGPAGFLPTVSSFAGLYSVPTGTWTLGMYDGGAGDIGTLTSWSIEITYLAGATATGVFSSPTAPGTIFTDILGTVPYVPGTPVSTVYVNPTVSTNYTLVVTTPLCVSATTTIPVTVSTPLDVRLDARDSVCVGNTETLVVNATGNIQNVRFQVSTDGGVTFTNIANGGIYSGATTSTLTIAGAPITANGYIYRAIASNACNTDTTNNNVLVVNPLPVITVSANPVTALTPGVTTTLSAAVSPNAAATYQWYLNGIIIPGATASTLVVDIDDLGDYTVAVSDVNGCTSTSSALNITSANSENLFIYPSPNTGQFQVRYNSTIGNTNVIRMLSVYDSKGARVYQSTYTIAAPYQRMDVDLRMHGKGVYTVELTDRTGRRVKTGRVVVF